MITITITRITKTREEVIAKIKELEGKEKVKAVALNYYLEKKKDLDKELEEKIASLTREYDLKGIPFIEAVRIF